MFILNLLKNKYFIVTIVFIVWIVFFAQYDIITQMRHRNELHDMRTKIEYLEHEVDRLNAEKVALKSDSVTVEKYAREKYFMKAANEDVFVFDTIAAPTTSLKK